MRLAFTRSSKRRSAALPTSISGAINASSYQVRMATRTVADGATMSLAILPAIRSPILALTAFGSRLLRVPSPCRSVADRARRGARHHHRALLPLSFVPIARRNLGSAFRNSMPRRASGCWRRISAALAISIFETTMAWCEQRRAAST